MKYLKLIILAIVLAIIALRSLPDGTFKTTKSQLEVNPAWQKAVDYAKSNLSLKGQLIKKSDGFIYLKVDDNYIFSLYPMLGLKKEGFKKPPYFRNPEAPGAHISVFYENEKINPEEIGQYFHFTPKRILIVKPSDGISYAVLEVESPELEKLREKYGLTPKLQGNDFHISLAKKTKHPRH